MNKNGYILSRQWFDFAFENPEKITPSHAALMFWLIELNNRLGWKTKFGVPTIHTMETIGIKSYNTYKKIFFDLVNWGFIKVIEKSKNQYTSNVISLNNLDTTSLNALSNALSNFDKAPTKHLTKHNDIDKQINNKTINIPDFSVFKDFALSKDATIDIKALYLKYQAWKENNWMDGNNKIIKNWKSKLLNTLPYLPKMQTKDISKNIIYTKPDNLL